MLGIDGCGGGWAVAQNRALGPICLDVHGSLAEISVAYTGARHCFIDMPMGLPRRGPRACDALARRLLGSRASTVFPVPCREAVYAGDYVRACAVNERCQGRRLSRQLWNLVPKIIELDRLAVARGDGPALYESHPELCFAALNGGTPLLSKKRDRSGRRERLALLESVQPGITTVFEDALARLRRRGAMADDLLDAMVLALSAALPRNRWRSLPDPPERDELGTEMAIIAPAPHGRLALSPGTREVGGRRPDGDSCSGEQGKNSSG